jgi:hypothetical protein
MGRQVQHDAVVEQFSVNLTALAVQAHPEPAGLRAKPGRIIPSTSPARGPRKLLNASAIGARQGAGGV